MRNFNSEQLKSISGFFSTVASAWFVAATVNPLFTQTTEIVRSLLLALVGIIAAGAFMFVSVSIIKEA